MPSYALRSGGSRMPICAWCHQKIDVKRYFHIEVCEGWDDREKAPDYTGSEVFICSLDCMIEWAKAIKENEKEES